MEYALVAKGVTKEFNGRSIIENVSFSVKEGEIFGIIGMSGSGKTTVLHHLIGFLEPDEGEVLFNSKSGLISLSENVLEARKKFGFSPQRPSFYPQLTIEENLIYFGGLYNIEINEIYRNMKRLLAITQLTIHREKLAEELSGGMQRRLSVACSLIHSPRLLLLDEPTSDLDPILREEMWGLIKVINKLGTTIVVASHFLEELERVCNTIAILHEGSILKTGDMQTLRREFSHDCQEITLSFPDEGSAKRALTMLKRYNPKRSGEKIGIMAKQPLRVLLRVASAAKEAESIHLHSPSLREVFVNIAKK